MVWWLIVCIWIWQIFYIRKKLKPEYYVDILESIFKESFLNLIIWHLIFGSGLQNGMVFQYMMHFAVIHSLYVSCVRLIPVLLLVTNSTIITFAISFLLGQINWWLASYMRANGYKQRIILLNNYSEHCCSFKMDCFHVSAAVVKACIWLLFFLIKAY